jgi:hypothetical protein
MITQIVDTGQPTSDEYGSLSELVNGLSVETADSNGAIVVLSGQRTIKSNHDWAARCFDMTLTNFTSGNDFVEVRWTFAKSGVPLRLRGDNNERLRVVLNDTLTGLVHHTFLAQGYIENGEP